MKSEQGKRKNLSALEQLKSMGLRITQPRKKILNFLSSGHGPYSIEEIEKGIGISSCDVVTIYRNLHTLEELNIVRRCDLGDRLARYELAHAIHPHHHLICKNCKQVDVINNDKITLVIDSIARKRGFKQVNPFIEIFGLCPNCA